MTYVLPNQSIDRIAQRLPLGAPSELRAYRSILLAHWQNGTLGAQFVLCRIENTGKFLVEPSDPSEEVTQ